jgi:hypothetical protein
MSLINPILAARKYSVEFAVVVIEPRIGGVGRGAVGHWVEALGNMGHDLAPSDLL